MPFGQGAAAPQHTTGAGGPTATGWPHALVSPGELEAAGAAIVGAFQTTPATLPFTQRLMSRKLIATVLFEIATLVTSIAGGLPHNEAGIIAGVGTAAYLLAQGVSDAAGMLNAPPPGTTNVPTALLTPPASSTPSGGAP